MEVENVTKNIKWRFLGFESKSNHNWDV
jgi:hypothetical protein